MLPGPAIGFDSAEIQLLRTIDDLTRRIFLADCAARRSSLRESVATLRAELIRLLEATPIPDEDDVARFQHPGAGLYSPGTRPAS